MKGYKTLKQFVYDYKLYIAAKEIDPIRESGETITSLLKKRINSMFNNASKNFKAMMAKRNYSFVDLWLIGAHDTLPSIRSLDDFLKICFGKEYVNKKEYRKVLSSSAFRTGRLKRLYALVPRNIETKKDFLRFMKSRRDIGKDELSVLMSICRKEWRKWLFELIDKNIVYESDGRWYA